MEAVISVFKFIIAHHQEIISGLVLLLSGVIALALLIPGEQPEKFLQKIVDLLKKISRKPAEPPKAE